MAAETNISRLNWVDYAKGLGIILVVFGHVIKGLFTVKLINPVFFNYAVNLVYSFHMPLFFILSGYFFLSSLVKRGNKSFLINKLETIAYPFIIWLTLQTLIEIKLSAYTNNHIHANVLLTMFYKPTDQFWFLFALFFINVLCVLFFNISKKWGLLISLIVWLVYRNFPLVFNTFDKTFLNLIYFIAGITLSKYSNVTRQLLNNIYIFIANVLIFSIAIYLYFTYPHDTWYNQLLPQFSGSFIIIFISEACSKKSTLKFLEYLGINSMVIYLVHILAASGSRIFLYRVLHIQNTAVHILVGTFLGIVIPLLVYKVANKTKYLSWLFIFPRRRTITSL